MIAKGKAMVGVEEKVADMANTVDMMDIKHSGVTVDESVRKIEGSKDEDGSEEVKDNICQLLNQRMASQRRDKSCTPSH